MVVFATKSKSEYVLFVKVKGFLEDPEKSMLIENQNIENFEGDDEKYTPNRYEIREGGNDTKYVYLPISILLEDQIVKGILLEKLGVYKANSTKINNILKGLRPTRISNKTAGVKAGYVNYYKADFETTKKELPGDYMRMYTLSFITPAFYNLDDVEQHLFDNGKIQIISQNLVYNYVSGSARIIGGRKYKK